VHGAIVTDFGTGAHRQERAAVAHKREARNAGRAAVHDRRDAYAGEWPVRARHVLARPYLELDAQGPDACEPLVSPVAALREPRTTRGASTSLRDSVPRLGASSLPRRPRRGSRASTPTSCPRRKTCGVGARSSRERPASTWRLRPGVRHSG